MGITLKKGFFRGGFNLSNTEAFGWRRLIILSLKLVAEEFQACSLQSDRNDCGRTEDDVRRVWKNERAGEKVEYTDRVVCQGAS